MARPKDKNSRRSRAERRRQRKAVEDAARGISDTRKDPNEKVQARRKTFSFVRDDLEGRGGMIDQDIFDGLGQMHAVGLLSGHGHDGKDLRDIGRKWGDHYATLLKCCAVKTSSYERMDRGVKEYVYTKADEAWDNMDEALCGFERMALLSLIVDPMIGDFGGEPVTPWAQALIDEKLAERGVFKALMLFPSAHERELYRAAIRGLCTLYDASLPSRRSWAINDGTSPDEDRSAA